MLVRRPADGSFSCIHQEQHALISGILAAAWRPRLDPRLVAAITLHDNPWRPIDATPRVEDGEVVDFINYPIEERIAFYADGITELEAVDPYIAYMVSLHYSSFVGVHAKADFRAAESVRRERLVPVLGDVVSRTAEDLRWLQYFDLFSLHVCLTGPDVPDRHLPGWLREPSKWSAPPDGRAVELAWTDPGTLAVTAWPFLPDDLSFDVVETIDGTPSARSICLVPGL